MHKPESERCAVRIQLSKNLTANGNAMAWSDYVIFVDESGDHSLEAVDTQYPVFVLSFCIFSRENYLRVAVPAIKELKIRYFGHDLAILHERDIRRRTGWYSKLSRAEHESFVMELSGIMEATDFVIIAMIMKKTG